MHVEGQLGCDGAIVSYWSLATDTDAVFDHCVEQSVRDARLAVGLEDARICLVDHWDDTKPDGVVQVDESLWRWSDINLWPKGDQKEAEPEFWFPIGVVPAEGDDGIDPDEIREAFAVGEDDECHWVKAVVDRGHIKDIFSKCFWSLLSRDGFEVRLPGYWESTGKTELFLGDERYVDAAILDYLDNDKNGLFNNGRVELAVYSREQRATLRLSDHKMVGFSAEHVQHRDEMAEVLRVNAIIQVTTLCSLAERCGHFHYALPSCPNTRAEMKAMLAEDGFHKVDEWDDNDG